MIARMIYPKILYFSVVKAMYDRIDYLEGRTVYFMYVDESGDPGPYDMTRPAKKRGSRHFIVSGVIVPALEWRNYLTAMVEVRRAVKLRYGLRVRSELHGSELINPRNPEYMGLGTRERRVNLYAGILRSIVARMPQVKIINVHVDKVNPRSPAALSGRDVDEVAWERLIQRFSTYLQRSCNGSIGMVFADGLCPKSRLTVVKFFLLPLYMVGRRLFEQSLADATNEVKMRRLLRRMRVFNYITSHYGGFYPAPVENIVEDPVMRNSKHSYFVQIADLTVHALYQHLYPRGSYRTFNIDRLFDLLDPLLLKAASPRDPRGIVHV